MNFLRNLSISARFYIVTVCIVLMTALVSQVYFAKQQRTAFSDRLREKIVFFNKAYSFLIADALNRKDDLLLQQVVNTLEQDQEITSIVVVDKQGEIRYHADAEKVGSVIDDPQVLEAIKTGDAATRESSNSGGKSMILVSPLKLEAVPEPLGCVRIELTYRFLDIQIQRIHAYYMLLIIGIVLMAFSATYFLVTQWIIIPAEGLRLSIEALKPSALDANLIEGTDEFGSINKALNEFILRIKAEWHTQELDKARRAEGERLWVQQLSRAFWTDRRVLIADKDNHLLLDTSKEVPANPDEAPHLLDLITDSNFATLINASFQTEGEVARGDVSFEDLPYSAGVLSILPNQSLLVKTIIVLEPLNASATTSG